MEWLEILIQGGALGTVIALIWYMNQRDKRAKDKEEMHNTTIDNHLKHSTDAQKKTAAAQVKLAKSLTGLKDVIRNKLN